MFICLSNVYSVFLAPEPPIASSLKTTNSNASFSAQNFSIELIT